MQIELVTPKQAGSQRRRAVESEFFIRLAAL